jgi:hypothetical protein
LFLAENSRKWMDSIASLFAVLGNISFYLSISLAHLSSFHQSTIFFSVLLFVALFTCFTWPSFKFQTGRQTPILFISNCPPPHPTPPPTSGRDIPGAPPPRSCSPFSTHKAILLTDFSSYSQCRFLFWCSLLYSSRHIRFKTSASSRFTTQSCSQFPKEKKRNAFVFPMSLIQTA